MMLRIAVCDDEENQRNEMAALLRSYFSTRPDLHGLVETFQNGKELITRAESLQNFDIYILDIIMPELSGIELGRRLRALGDGGEIVYLTSSNDFAADSYDVHAFFYLLKPVNQSKLFQVLDGALEKLSQRRNSAVVVTTEDGPRRILLERIQYVERIGRCIRYSCTDGIVDSQTIRLSFRKMVAPLLADQRFCLCGASFVLNFQHVTGVNGQVALFDSGQTVVLPRTAATEFKKSWGNYWLGEHTL